MIQKALFLLISASVLSCAVTDRENDGEVFCNINRSESYQVGTDPSTDFNQVNLVKTVSFNNNDCPNVDNDSFDVFVSRVRRRGDTLNIFDSQFASGGFRLEMSVSGTNLMPVSNVVNINNCSVVRQWTGSLDVAGTSVDVIQNIIYKGNCAPVFKMPEDERPDSPR